MRKSSLFGLIATGLVLGAAAVDHALPRVTPSQTVVVPVAKLSRTIGPYVNSEDEPVEKRVLDSLPTATIIQRVYRDQANHPVQVLLETATRASDYHPETYCMSAQGWNIVSTQSINVGRIPTTLLNMRASDGSECALLYWYSLDKNSDAWTVAAARLMSGQSPTRLFVRVIVGADAGLPAASRRAEEFAALLAPEVQRLEAER
jgi:hypothetical protein